LLLGVLKLWTFKWVLTFFIKSVYDLKIPSERKTEKYYKCCKIELRGHSNDTFFGLFQTPISRCHLATLERTSRGPSCDVTFFNFQTKFFQGYKQLKMINQWSKNVTWHFGWPPFPRVLIGDIVSNHLKSFTYCLNGPKALHTKLVIKFSIKIRVGTIISRK